MRREEEDSQFDGGGASRLTSHVSPLTPDDPRTRWLCRRGMKELDVLLERFYASEFAGLQADERTAFVALLEFEDPDLYAALIHGATLDDPVQAALAARIREYRRVV